MRFRVLGPLEVLHDGERIPLSRIKSKALALLLLECGLWVPAHRFADVLWDDEPPSTATRQVQNTLAALRRVLAAHGGDPVERSGRGYRLRSDEVDLARFERDVARAREAGPAGDDEEAAALLESALGLWRGPAFADLGGDRIQAAAARLERKRIAAMEALNDAELALARDESVATRARELLEIDPFHQRAAAQLMLALRARGRGVEALEVYSEIRTRLSDELGLDPDSDLREAQRMVLRAEPTSPASAPNAPSVPVPAQLPAGVSGFCGRDTDLGKLDDLFGPPADTLPIAVVCGPGGVGKTALAIEWAQRARDSFPDGQLYVDLRGFDPSGSVLGAAEALRGFLTALGVGSAEMPSGVKARMEMYRSCTADRRLLVVLDNAHDAEQVEPLLPGAASCRVLVTSRRIMPSLTVRHGASHVRLNVLGNLEARTLLGRRLGESRATAEPEALESILRVCAGLPLALAIVAARAVTEPEFPLRAITERLQEADSALAALDSVDPLGDIRAVFSWSYRALSPEAARLFGLSGLHPGPDFSAAAVASLLGVTPRRARELLQELTGVHLLTENEPGRYRSHDLLAAYARERLATDVSESDQAKARRRLLGHYTGSASEASSRIDSRREVEPTPGAEHGAVVEAFDEAEAALEWVLAEVRVLANMVEFAERTGLDEYAVSLARSIAGALHRNGDWDIGLATQRCALRAARRLGDHRHEATVHLHIAMFLFSSSEFDLVERHLVEGLDLCDPERDMNLMARIEYRFAAHLDELGRIDEALGHCLAALRLFAESGDDDGRARALNGIGWFHAKSGRYAEALEYCGRSLSLCRAIGAVSIEASVLDTIGYLWHRQGRHSDAVEHYLQSLELSVSIGLRSTEVHTHEHLGDAYRAMGEPGPARDHWQRALTVFEVASDRHAARVRAKLDELGTPHRHR